MPYASVDDLAEYQGKKDFGANERRAQVALNTAGRIVEGVAPVPEDAMKLADYEGRAVDAELQIADWLVTTKGFLSSTSAPAGLGGKSYANDPAVLSMVSDAMGQYATANKPKKPAAIVSRMVRRG